MLAHSVLPMNLYLWHTTILIASARRRFAQTRQLRPSPSWIFCSYADLTGTVAIALRPFIITTTITIVILIGVIIRNIVETHGTCLPNASKGRRRPFTSCGRHPCTEANNGHVDNEGFPRHNSLAVALRFARISRLTVRCTRSTCTCSI